MSNKNKNTGFTLEEAKLYHSELRKAANSISKKILAARSKKGFLEFLKFGVTAAVIFSITFVGMNFSAYKKQISFWLENAKAELFVAKVSSTEETEKTKPKLAKLKVEKQKAKTANNKKNLPAIKLKTVSPPDNRIIIPRLGIHAPIREAHGINIKEGDWADIEKKVQVALRDGVVHFPGTAKAGEVGNAFITGHSSYYPWDSGRYKEIFALLPQIKPGDEIIVWQDQQVYKYRVAKTEEVPPDKTDVLDPTDNYRLTLMTCTPLGTSLRRLIVTAYLES